MKISLVIPAYNEEKYIHGCLASVREHGGDFHEVIVIDNASTDRTAEIAQSFPWVRVVHEPAKGLTKARQRGLEEATGDVIAFFDADTRMPLRWMAQARRMLADPNVVCISGPYRYYDGPWFRNQIIHFLWWMSYAPMYRIVGHMVAGANFTARKDALIAMGGFDRTIEFHGEDTDVSRRIAKHGKVIFRMNFFIYSSSRRYDAEGIVWPCATYAVNCLWQLFFHRPLTKKHADIR